jgi:hypothetical protein
MPSASEFAAKVAAITFAMPSVTTDMLSERKQRDAMRRFKFFPGPAEIAEWLEPEIKEQARFNQAMAIEAPRPEIRGPRTLEELAYAAEAMKKIKANLSGLNPDAPAELPPVKPRYLSEGHLLAQLDQIVREGGPCAGASKLRADAIRARARQQVPA